jgi:hypothetical protein
MPVPKDNMPPIHPGEYLREELQETRSIDLTTAPPAIQNLISAPLSSAFCFEAPTVTESSRRVAIVKARVPMISASRTVGARDLTPYQSSSPTNRNTRRISRLIVTSTRRVELGWNNPLTCFGVSFTDAESSP